MLTRIQHVAVGVGDLAAGSEAYRRLGFELRREGACAIAFNDADFLELRDDEGLPGLRHVAIESDQVDADSAAMASRGAAAFVLLAGPRRQPAGAAAHPN